MLIRLDPQDVLEWWPDIEPLVDRVLEREEVRAKFRSVHVFSSLFCGTETAWLLLNEDLEIQVLVITQQVKYPLQMSLRVNYMVGRGALDNLDYLNEIEAWGVANGVQSFEVWGREGFSRALQGKGYKKVQTNLFKQVET